MNTNNDGSPPRPRPSTSRPFANPWIDPPSSVPPGDNNPANNPPPNNPETANENETNPTAANRQRLAIAPTIAPMNDVLWRERERRQKTVRAFLMMLFLLLLLDDDPNRPDPWKEDLQQQQQRLRRHRSSPREREAEVPVRRRFSLDSTVYESRIAQDEALQTLLSRDQRYQELVQKNKGRPVDAEIREWARQHLTDGSTTEKTPEQEEEEAVEVWHYPWNATGLYLGEWGRQDTAADPIETALSHGAKITASNWTEAPFLEEPMLRVLQQKGQTAGVFFLPQPVHVRDDNNLTSLQWERLSMDPNGREYLPEDWAAATAQNPFLSLPTPDEADGLSLQQTSGRIAMRLFARPVPAMEELSVVDGSVKLYDRHSHHYASPRDVVIRVRGVLLRRTGKLSLVSAYQPVTHSALIVQPADQKAARRRLQESNPGTLEQLRDDVWMAHANSLQGWVEENEQRRLSEDGNDGSIGEKVEDPPAHMTANLSTPNEFLESNPELPIWSDVVIPYPYIRDDSEETFRQGRTPASRRMMPQERILEANAAHCLFEMNFNVEAEEWTVGEWRKLLRRKVFEKERLNSTAYPNMTAVATQEGSVSTGANPASGIQPDSSAAHKNWPGRLHHRRRSPPRDEALVMVMNGTIRSDNCHFLVNVNATAFRTNWEVTTSRAMNYCLYMMLVCLAQIIILLRQLLHSQAQSAATRVSMTAVGWQTVIDGLMCLGHLYLCLAMQNMFTAFASVAFFKLLIFCVIEMKYMAIIIQARNSANGGQPTDVLRRQVALLHLRYYIALFGTLILLFYVGENSRWLYFLVLYSFWVPQIVLNVITQAKTPLHKHYIYGMGVSRLVSPLYVFCIKNNFLREVYPDIPYDPRLGQLLVVWVGVQTALLWAQGKYGARFMIPSFFLPPKFDYSRSIPVSMLPPGAMEMHTDTLDDEDARGGDPKRESEVLTSTSDRHTTAVTTRMRRTASTTMSSPTTVVVAEPPTPRPSRPTLDCCICYDSIDIRDRQAYMLAPCDHLFHRYVADPLACMPSFFALSFVSCIPPLQLLP
jgi:hypothetical protein